MQVSGFGELGQLTQSLRLVSASCSSGQRFALQLPSDSQSPGKPLPSANSSPCRASRGLSPPSECALPGAPKKSPSPDGETGSTPHDACCSERAGQIIRKGARRNSENTLAFVRLRAPPSLLRMTARCAPSTTTFQVLKEPGRRPQAKSCLWAQVNGSGPPVRRFRYVSRRRVAKDIRCSGLATSLAPR